MVEQKRPFAGRVVKHDGGLELGHVDVTVEQRRKPNGGFGPVAFL